MTASPIRFDYGTDPLQYAELHLPDDLPHGVVVLIHGGFWRAGVGTHGLAPMAHALVALGYAAWEVEYRAVGSGGGWPATTEDVAAAVDLLARALQVSNVPPVPAAVVGHSAGGQLSVWAGARAARGEGPQRLAGAVSLGGVLDLTGGAAERVGDGAVQAFLGGEPEAVPDAYRDADPTRLATSGQAAARVRSVHGDADDIVPPVHSIRFTDAAREGGWDARLEIVPGDHFVVVDPGSHTWPTVLRAIREALGAEA